jgi:hypothetical protein
MSSSPNGICTTLDAQSVTATTGARPALEQVTATSPEHTPPERSFATAAAAPSATTAPPAITATPSKDGGGSKPAKPERKYTEQETSQYEARKRLREWEAARTEEGDFIANCDVFPTRQQKTRTEKGEKPKPSIKDIKRKMASIRGVFGDAKINITTMENETCFFKKVTVAIPGLTPEDRKRFENQGFQVKEQKIFSGQTWESWIELKARKTVERPVGQFGPKTEPLKDVIRYADGLPDMPAGIEGEDLIRWLKGQPVPRCAKPRPSKHRPGGGLWNPLPGVKQARCQKSGKHPGGYRGQSKRNLEVFAAINTNKKPPHLFCQFTKTDLWALGVTTREDYKRIQTWWREDSAAMLKHDEERKASEAAKVARTQRRTAAKAASAPDPNGFRLVVAGGGAKPEPEEPEVLLMTPSAFSALHVESVESEDEEPEEPEKPEKPEEPDTCARPDPAELEPEEPKRKLNKAERQRANRAKKGTKLLFDA